MPSLPSRSNFLCIAACSSYEPWIKYSTGDNSRYISIHISTIIAWRYLSHNFKNPCTLTRSEATRKTGTKAAALKANYHLLVSLGQSRRPIFLALKQRKNTFDLFLIQKKIAMHLMIYGIFPIQRRTKWNDLCQLLLICHMYRLLDHFKSI